MHSNKDIEKKQFDGVGDTISLSSIPKNFITPYFFLKTYCTVADSENTEQTKGWIEGNLKNYQWRGTSIFQIDI